MLTVLIDGDVLCYQTAAGAEVATEWGDDLWTLHADAGRARGRLLDKVADVVDGTGATRVVCALTDDSNFRKDVLPTYKSNRVGVRKPMLLAQMREFMAAEFETVVKPGLEGDDVLGILATHPTIVPGQKVVVSIDKDMRTVPGKFLDWGVWLEAKAAGRAKTPSDVVVTITEADADAYHMQQTLSGDATDGYAGCPGIGVGGAEKALREKPPHVLVEEDYTPTRGKNKGKAGKRWVEVEGAYTPWQTVVSYYARAGLGEGEALRQARVARILRWDEYDYVKKAPILWTPRAR